MSIQPLTVIGQRGVSGRRAVFDVEEGIPHGFGTVIIPAHKMAVVGALETTVTGDRATRDSATVRHSLGILKGRCINFDLLKPKFICDRVGNYISCRTYTGYANSLG